MKNIVFVFVLAGLVSCSQSPPQFGEPSLKPGAGVRGHDADPRANLLSVYFLAEKWDLYEFLRPDVRDDPRGIRAVEELFAHDKTATMSQPLSNGRSQ